MGKGTRATAGHMPLTHYERTKKFVTNNNLKDSADYGTLQHRLAGYTQYQIGTCALTTQSLYSTSDIPSSLSNDDRTTNISSIALCSPSGYIYDESSIIEYLLKQTQDIKQKQIEYNNTITKQQQQFELQKNSQIKKRQMDEFINSQTIISSNNHNKRNKSNHEQSSLHQNAINDLHRVSYWLSTAQPIQPQQSSLSTTPTTTSNDQHHSNQSILALTASPSSTALTTTSTTNVDTSSNNNVVLDEPTQIVSKPVVIDRPVSPMTQQPLSRRDLWPIRLEWTNTASNSTSTRIPKVKCAISDRVISNGASVVAYWTVKKPYSSTASKSNNNHNNNIGVIVLQSVFDHELKLKNDNNNNNHKNKSDNDMNTNTTNTNKSIRYCPITDRPIYHIRTLQRSGSNYAASGQSIMSQTQYKPTIT